MNKVLVLLLVLFSGCVSERHELAPEWAPLTQVVERNLPFVSDTASTTIGETVCVADLEAWLKHYPPGSASYIALLKHEQVHAIRQLNYGLAPWIAKYVADKQFAWEEEKLGFAEQIRYLRTHGQYYPPEHWARILADKYRGMVTYEEALRWVVSIYSGL